MPTPNEVSEAAVCFACIEDKVSSMLYLLDQIRIEQGGSEMTANEISEAAGEACFPCIEDKVSSMLYLLAEIVSGGGAGAQREFFGSFGDPNGNQTANGAADYYDSDGSVWKHYSLGNNNTNWVAVIS